MMGKRAEAASAAPLGAFEAAQLWFGSAAELSARADPQEILEVGRAGVHLRRELRAAARASVKSASDPVLGRAEADAEQGKADQLRRASERVTMVLESLKVRHREAVARKENEGRLRRYEAAKEAAEEAAGRLGAIELAYRTAIASAALAREAIEEANRALPAGADPLVIPDAISAEEVVSAEEIDGWVDGHGQRHEGEPAMISADGYTALSRPQRSGEELLRKAKFKRVVYRVRGDASTRERFERLADDPRAAGAQPPEGFRD